MRKYRKPTTHTMRHRALELLPKTEAFSSFDVCNLLGIKPEKANVLLYRMARYGDVTRVAWGHYRLAYRPQVCPTCNRPLPAGEQ